MGREGYAYSGVSRGVGRQTRIASAVSAPRRHKRYPPCSSRDEGPLEDRDLKRKGPYGVSGSGFTGPNTLGHKPRPPNGSRPDHSCRRLLVPGPVLRHERPAGAVPSPAHGTRDVSSGGLRVRQDPSVSTHLPPPVPRVVDGGTRGYLPVMTLNRSQNRTTCFACFVVLFVVLWFVVFLPRWFCVKDFFVFTLSVSPSPRSFAELPGS